MTSVFDEKGYKREMEKAFKEIKRNLDKFIKSQNEKYKNKKASTTRSCIPSATEGLCLVVEAIKWVGLLSIRVSLC